MILHLGSDVFVKKKDIIAILDAKGAEKSTDTSLFLREARVAFAAPETHKSIVVAQGEDGHVLYYSHISAKTLEKRAAAEDGVFDV